MSASSPAFFVLSGGPCSGKTTLLAELAARGHPVVTEAATELIADPLTRDLRADPLDFQRRVLERQLENEARALDAHDGERLVFLDRGVGDGFAYLAHHGLAPFPEILAAWERVVGRYRAILFFAQRPDYHAATHRAENAADARAVHVRLLTEYRTRHARVIEVPWIPVDERVDRVIREAERLL